MYAYRLAHCVNNIERKKLHKGQTSVYCTTAQSDHRGWLVRRCVVCVFITKKICLPYISKNHPVVEQILLRINVRVLDCNFAEIFDIRK